MGCQVQLSTVQPYFRTDKVQIVSFLHFLRFLVYVALSFVVDDGFMTLLWIGLAELLVAWWFWNLRMESWGLSLGVCVVQFLFPIAMDILLLGGIIILLAAASQMALLILIRLEGGYSFSHMVALDQTESRVTTTLQSRMFHLAVLAQMMKALVVIAGAFWTLSYLGWSESIPWLTSVPLVPFTLFLGFLNLAAGIGFLLGREWGFQLTVTMIPVSFVETLLTLNGLVFLLGVWTLTLLLPCLAKDGFYSKLFRRTRTSIEHTQEVISTQELASSSDIE